MHGRARLAITARIVVRIAILAVCVCTWARADTALAEEAVRRALILYPDDEQRGPAINIVGDIVSKRFLKSSPPRIDVFSDYLDLSRFPGVDHRAREADFLARKYAATRLDVVVALRRPALDFILQYRDRIAPGAKIVFGIVSDRGPVESGASSDVVGVLSDYDLGKTLELAARLQPGARHVVVVTGAGAFDRSWEEKARALLTPLAGRYETTFLSGLPFDELLRKVSVLPRDTIVLILTVYRDKTGRNLVPVEAARQVADAADAPSYSPYDFDLGLGTVGGYTDTFQSIGSAVADLALDVLAGKAEALQDRHTGPLAFRVDARQLKRWGLSKANLPAGTVLLFDEKSVWDEYGYVIVGVLAVIALQAALLAALLIQRVSRRRAEAALKESERQGEAQRREITHMSRVLLLGELTQTIAHELNQPLTGILANAEAAQMMLAGKSPDIEEALAALADIVDDDKRAGEVIRRVRGFLKKDESHLERIDINEIVTSAQGLIRSELVNRRITARVELAQKIEPVLGDPVQLQQVTLNLMMNAMDALASVASVNRQIIVRTRAAEDGYVEVAISDNGSGIAPADQARLFQPFFTTKPLGLGLGLSICSTILNLHGGKLSLVNQDEGGVLASFMLPPAKMLAAAK